MQQLFQMFYRTVGVRRPQNLVAPTPVPELTFALPRDAVLHYTEREADKSQLNDQLPIFDQYTKRVMVDHVSELVEPIGKPLRKGVQFNNLVRDFHLKNKKFKFGINSHTATADPNTLVVVNYSFLDDLYKYSTVPISEYHKWHNTFKCLWEKASEIAKTSGREQFIFVDLPAMLPSIATLNRFMGKADSTFVAVFNSPEKLFFMDIWKWLSAEYKSDSLISLVPTEHLFKINLVFRDHRCLSVLNLGYLNAWLRGSDTASKDTGSLKLDNLQLQKFFLKYSIELKNRLPVEEEEVVDEVKPISNSVDLDSELDDGETQDYSLGAVKTSKDFKLPEPVQKQELSVTEPEEEEAFSVDTSLAGIDEDLKALDLAEKKAALGNTIKIRADDSVKDQVVAPPEVPIHDTLQEEIYKPKTAEQALVEQIDQLLEFGVITPTEHRTLKKQAQMSGMLADPYGNAASVAEMSVVTEQDTAITEDDKKLQGNDVLLDPSMASSSVKTFDAKYVTTVLPKDIIACVQSVQKAGMIILEHTVTIEESVVGSYEYHTLKVKAVDGATSTLRFKIPKVNEEGQIFVQGSKYVLRKQQVD